MDVTKSLTKKTKKLQITDQDGNNEQGVDGVADYYEQFSPVSKTCFQVCPGKRKSNKTQVVIHSDVFTNNSKILCGFDNDQIVAVDISEALSSDVVELPPKSGAILHPGLSFARCSKVTPDVFFSSSTEDGKINLWDGRIKSTKPSQTFTPCTGQTASGTAQNAKKKPILSFDLSAGDQFLCAGTELVEEDSFLLFWDLRSTKLMGAYWESHSDDITTVKFHSTKPTSLASGSTDGLLNVYNLLEATEEDALVFSFNTETSVVSCSVQEKITWNSPASGSLSDNIACITHLNDLRIWDVENGDIVADLSRNDIATAMKRSNPDAVHLNECYEMPNGSTGLFSCSLTGDSCGTLEVINGKLSPRALFLMETSVIQTTEYLQTDNQWLTFDENGIMKIWSLDFTQPGFDEGFPTKAQALGKRPSRFKPY